MRLLIARLMKALALTTKTMWHPLNYIPHFHPLKKSLTLSLCSHIHFHDNSHFSIITAHQEKHLSILTHDNLQNR